MKRFLFITLLALSLAACGLAEDEQDDKNKRIYITFTDPAFEAYCLRQFDSNGSGRLSVYTAQRILQIDCPGLGIRSLSDIAYFTHLQELDCADNLLAELDLRKCPDLRSVDCSNNELGWLDVEGLRGLRTIDCSGNRLPGLLLGSNVSLTWLDCSRNALSGTLDLTACPTGLSADVRGNPALTVVYCLPSQSISADGQTRIEVR